MLIVWGTRTGMITHANTCQHFHITKTHSMPISIHGSKVCLKSTSLPLEFMTWYCSGRTKALAPDGHIQKYRKTWHQNDMDMFRAQKGFGSRVPHQKIKKNLANQTNHKEPNLGRLPELSVSTSCREVDRCWWCINYISDQNMCIYLWTCLWLGINSMCMYLNHTKAPVDHPASKQMIITRRVCEEVLKTSFLFRKQTHVSAIKSLEP